ncbi:excisionase family DNA-binding protein [Thermosphaera chiliense]|uniref:Excisionase family DNA-binding protein n=1 Tax=Thermosphaera chiliense TaxID=3402707 RepID=A0A7M1UUI0_9CREN|nr:excisionase family DNA-binding protein [Thermosphaera aggregans]QOR94674.1 excisionase family DNA-binding protein [Thermosphaera aggregans]
MSVKTYIFIDKREVALGKSYFSTREVARLLGVIDRTVRRWIREGRIGAVRMRRRWLIPAYELKALQPVLRDPGVKASRVAIYVYRHVSGEKIIPPPSRSPNSSLLRRR